MNEDLTNILIEELLQNPGIKAVHNFTPKIYLFKEVLMSDISEQSERFYEKLPHKSQTLVESEMRYYSLSLRRLLRNRNAKDFELTPTKAAYERLLSKLGIYSSDAMTRSLRLDQDIVNMMSACEHPFSVLGKLQTYEIGRENVLLRRTRPILLIADSGRGDRARIESWETANQKYEEEKGILSTFKPIRHDEYIQALV